MWKKNPWAVAWWFLDKELGWSRELFLRHFSSWGIMCVPIQALFSISSSCLGVVRVIDGVFFVSGSVNDFCILFPGWVSHSARKQPVNHTVPHPGPGLTLSPDQPPSSWTGMWCRESLLHAVLPRKQLHRKHRNVLVLNTVKSSSRDAALVKLSSVSLFAAFHPMHLTS